MIFKEVVVVDEEGDSVIAIVRGNQLVVYTSGGRDRVIRQKAGRYPLMIAGLTTILLAPLEAVLSPILSVASVIAGVIIYAKGLMLARKDSDGGSADVNQVISIARKALQACRRQSTNEMLEEIGRLKCMRRSPHPTIYPPTALLIPSATVGLAGLLIGEWWLFYTGIISVVVSMLVYMILPRKSQTL